ncbi:MULTISPECIES: DUF4184 family protein [Micromonospora]|uniref:DUF4184 family protein n=1 Tax=Micromonospora solifontis TaxID=2487138 RepID=A0ABX9WE03_9ACTN|nr:MULTISPECIES: DUF4184 family protein [Micromonospora]NES14974.1 DUF4184 family protein [Micromonospora sp. PPF5-17B]NES38564.1 DUF4184 family protein [Micromonospora solifontis]NES58587.1 DUF4184 family protein [Micromonospora sp. PPF5-6]RNL94587.1 DUF4184 family protein [Micromonospora solifontis]
MPLTFPSHLAPVLPLKLWRPRWFDGVALATGAVAPDVGYLFTGAGWAPGLRTHTLGGLLWWCLPVALAYAWLVRRVIAGIAVHLPLDRLFGWRDHAALAGVRHPWQVTVCSALIGAASHVAWDRITHSDRWPRLLGIADFHAATGLYWWQFADVLGSLGGGAVVLALAVHAARRREIFQGVPPPAPPARPAVFWRVALAVTALGALVLPALPAATMAAPAGVRLLHLAALAMIAGAAGAGSLGRARRQAGPIARLDQEQRQIG